MHANLKLIWLLLRRIGQLGREALQHYRRTHAAQLAGSLSFMSILALVPILTVVLAVFSAYPELSKASMYLRHYIETELLPETGSKMIVNYLFNFSQSATKLGGASIIFLGITALLLLNRIEGALNQIWCITTTRKFGERVINYWVALTMGPMAVGGIFYLMLQSLSYSYGWLGMVHASLQVGLTKIISFVLLTSLFSFGYVALPNRPVLWSHGLVAAVMATLAIAILQNLFEWYLRAFPAFALIYGAFATLPIFLVWVYLCWQTFLLGACLVVRLEAVPDNSTTSWNEHDVIRQSEAMVRLLAALWQNFQNPAPVAMTTQDNGAKKTPTRFRHRLRRGQHALMRVFHRKKMQHLQLERLAQQMSLHPEHCRALLDKLEQAEWLRRTEGMGGEQWLYTCHPTAIRREALQQVLLSQSPASAGDWDGSAWLQRLLEAQNLTVLWQDIARAKENAL